MAALTAALTARLREKTVTGALLRLTRACEEGDKAELEAALQYAKRVAGEDA